MRKFNKGDYVIVTKTRQKGIVDDISSGSCLKYGVTFADSPKIGYYRAKELELFSTSTSTGTNMIEWAILVDADTGEYIDEFAKSSYSELMRSVDECVKSSEADVASQQGYALMYCSSDHKIKGLRININYSIKKEELF